MGVLGCTTVPKGNSHYSTGSATGSATSESGTSSVGGSGSASSDYWRKEVCTLTEYDWSDVTNSFAFPFGSDAYESDHYERSCACKLNSEIQKDTVQRVVVTGWPATWAATYSSAEEEVARETVPAYTMAFGDVMSSTDHVTLNGNVVFPTRPPVDDDQLDDGMWVFDSSTYNTTVQSLDLRAVVSLRTAYDDPDPTYVFGCQDYMDHKKPWVIIGEEGDSRWSDVIGRRALTPGGVELTASCTPGATPTLDFALVQLPWWGHRVPISVGGPMAFGGASYETITVQDFDGATAVRIHDGSSEVVLTPASPTVTRSGHPWHFGDNAWFVESSSSSAPIIQLDTSCAAVLPTAPAAAGYGLSMAQMEDLALELVGASHMSAFIDWLPGGARKVFTVRVEDGPAPRLRLELMATGVYLFHPLTSAGPNQWTFSLADFGVTASGSITRSAQALNLSVAGGSILLEGTSVSFGPASMTLMSAAVE